MPVAPDMPDDDLMLAYARGDAAAFEHLYARHEAGLYRFVRRLLGARFAAQVDEVFQECWLRIVAARENFVAGAGTGAGRWRAWAYTIAHNAAMDRLRGSGREVQVSTGEGGDDDEPGLDWLQAQLGHAAPAAEEEAFWRAAGQQMLHCLDELPAEQRAAFLLHYEDGDTLEGLATRLGLAFETAKSRLRYALKKLRHCMRHYLVDMEVGA